MSAREHKIDGERFVSLSDLKRILRDDPDGLLFDAAAVLQVAREHGDSTESQLRKLVATWLSAAVGDFSPLPGPKRFTDSKVDK